MSNQDKTTEQDFFTVELSKKVLDSHLKVSGNQSRLLTVRGLIQSLLSPYVDCFNHQVFEQHVQDTYSVIADKYRTTIVVQSSTVLYSRKKRVAYPSTAITNNKMQALLFADWKSLRGKKDESAFLALQDFLMRVFVTCSESTRYQIDFDDSYWNMLFDDTRANVSVEITVERG